MTDLEYESGSLLGPVDENQVREFREWYRENENASFEFDPSYLSYLRHSHGGVPKKRCFRTQRGRTRMIDRFLNFIDRKSNDPQACYNVEVVWSQIEERLTHDLLPFAVLFAGDMVCFKYDKPGRPSIVVWEHEKSAPREPYLDYVADDFDRFLGVLFVCTNE